MTLVSGLVVVAVLAAVGIVYFILRKNRIKARAVELGGEIFTLWAEMGPYSNGKESAMALSCVYRTVRPDGSEGDPKVFEKHAVSYDAETAKWEDVRISSLSSPRSPEFDNRLTIAKGMLAALQMNEGMFKDAGFQAGFERDANGNLVPTIRSVDGTEASSGMGPEAALQFAMMNDVGNKLLTDESTEATQLVDALKFIFKEMYDKDIGSPSSLGQFYFRMTSLAGEHPENLVTKTFVEFNDAYLEHKKKSN